MSIIPRQHSIIDQLGTRNTMRENAALVRSCKNTPLVKVKDAANVRSCKNTPLVKVKECCTCMIIGEHTLGRSIPN